MADRFCSFVIRHSPFVILSYFFFSVCIVCLRSRGLYFLSFSFSPPILRRKRVVMVAGFLADEEHGFDFLLSFTGSHENHLV